eukprot:16337137-Heterocapsa_arctica.AAC.1
MKFNTLDPYFQEVYTNLLMYWIAYADIDSFRVDGSAHISSDFSAYLATHTRHYAASLGKANFFVIGEVVSAQTPFGAQQIGKTRMRGEVPLPSRVQDLFDEICALYGDL